MKFTEPKENSAIDTQLFAAHKMKRHINGLPNDLGYLSVHYQSCIFVTWRKTNASSLIQIKVKHNKTKTKGAEIIFNITIIAQARKIMLKYRPANFEKNHPAADRKQTFFRGWLYRLTIIAKSYIIFRNIKSTSRNL